MKLSQKNLDELVQTVIEILAEQLAFLGPDKPEQLKQRMALLAQDLVVSQGMRAKGEISDQKADEFFDTQRRAVEGWILTCGGIGKITAENLVTVAINTVVGILVSLIARLASEE